MFPRAAVLCFSLAITLCSLMAFEELNSTLVRSGFIQGRESSKVAAPACLIVLLARIQPVFAGFQFANHGYPAVYERCFRKLDASAASEANRNIKTLLEV